MIFLRLLFYVTEITQKVGLGRKAFHHLFGKKYFGYRDNICSELPNSISIIIRPAVVNKVRSITHANEKEKEKHVKPQNAASDEPMALKKPTLSSIQKPFGSQEHMPGTISNVEHEPRDTSVVICVETHL